MFRLRALAADLAVDLPLVALALAVRARSLLEPCDDAFILLAVARNALTGFGPHLDPGSADAVLSTFLWPLLLAGGLAAGVPARALLAGLGALADLALVLAARRLVGEAVGSPLAGALAAALLATQPVLLLASQAGMETAGVLALLAATLVALGRGRAAGVALGVALLPWARVDATLAAAVILVFAWRGGAGRAPGGRRWLAAGALGGALAFVAHRLVFGLWLPASVTAKAAAGGGFSAAGALATTAEFGKAAIGQSAYWLVAPSPHLLALPLALFGLWRTLRTPALGARLAPLLLWAVAYVGLFVGAGRQYAVNFPWYFAPPLLALAALAAAGIAPATARFEARAVRSRRLAAPAVAILLLALAVLPAVAAGQRRVRANFTAHRERAYAAAALWLGRHGPAGAVASNEVGALAWFSPPGTRIVDLFGLSRDPGERGLSGEELAARRRPDAVISRLDFSWRRRLEAAEPGGRVWVRAGSLDLGLLPGLAARLEPHQQELREIWLALGQLGPAASAAGRRPVG